MLQGWWHKVVTILLSSWLYRTCWNNLATSLILSTMLLQVLNSLLQTCWQLDLGTSSACWQTCYKMWDFCVYTCVQNLLTIILTYHIDFTFWLSSGESGSGKSYTTQLLIKELMHLSCGPSQTDVVKVLFVLESNLIASFLFYNTPWKIYFYRGCLYDPA